MARITIDENACVGCGLCVNNCPDCFEMGDDGVAKVKGCESSSCDFNEVVAQCPVNCITIEE